VQTYSARLNIKLTTDVCNHKQKGIGLGINNVNLNIINNIKDEELKVIKHKSVSENKIIHHLSKIK